LVRWVCTVRMSSNFNRIFILDIDECLSAPCENNGTCYDLVNSYFCLCVPGYTGPECAISISPWFSIVVSLVHVVNYWTKTAKQHDKHTEYSCVFAWGFLVYLGCLRYCVRLANQKLRLSSKFKTKAPHVGALYARRWKLYLSLTSAFICSSTARLCRKTESQSDSHLWPIDLKINMDHR